MSTTLTNGLKLPDKGSVDWYADMQSNYTILDGAVGTVAEHTTALAGKAPLVHTHGNITNDGKVGTTANVPLITGTGGVVQAGSFGNAANTFCEGNDSRLSDARTPVAHTHTKSDVTDLLNSNFIPLANNSYDLGSSSYQWNKIYSADIVHTSGNETITGVKTLVDYWHLQAKNLKAGEGETYGRTGYSFIYTDKNDVTMGDVTLFKNANAARTFIRIRSGDYYTNGAPAAAGTLVQSALMVGTNVSGKKIIECDSDIVYPTTNNTTDLGTATAKWKTLNGVNPGALSLPVRDYNSSIALDTTDWVYDGTAFTLSMAMPGWAVIVAEAVDASDYIKIRLTTYTRSPGLDFGAVNIAGSYSIKACFPIDSIMCLCLKLTNGASSVKYARYYPCFGNV